jgi:hypothetical protein
MYTGYDDYLLEPSYGAEPEVLSIDHTHNQGSGVGAVVAAVVASYAGRRVAQDFDANPDVGMAAGAFAGAMVGWWVGGGVAHRFEGDDAFGALDVGNKNSSKRNQAFSMLKKISTAIGHQRSFSSSRFRGFTRGEAARARKEVKKALVSFAKDNNIKLKNPLDPLANKSTAQSNLQKVEEAPAAPPAAPTTTEPTPDPAAEPIPDTSDVWATPGATPVTSAAMPAAGIEPPQLAAGSLHQMVVRQPGAVAEAGWFGSPMWSDGPSRTVILSASAGILAVGGVTWWLVSR